MPQTPGSVQRSPQGLNARVRCSVVVVRDGSILLLHRTGPGAGDGVLLDDWVLPGGSPRPTEGMSACARREVLEETGLDAQIGRCLFVLEVTSVPPDAHRTLELVFAGALDRSDTPLRPEADRSAHFVPIDEIHHLRMRPPLAGHLRGLTRKHRLEGAAYLGNLWRPDDEAQLEATDA